MIGHKVTYLVAEATSPTKSCSLTSFPSQEMEVSENPGLRKDTADPTLMSTGYKKNRFYLFSRRDPHDVKGYAYFGGPCPYVCAHAV